MIKTFLPCLAKVTAMFETTAVLPTPPLPLVIDNTRVADMFSLVLLLSSLV